jgi:hypothetical protein
LFEVRASITAKTDYPLIREYVILHGRMLPRRSFCLNRNIDITATILHLAGAGPTNFDIDGRVMPWGDKGASKKDMGSVSHQLSEFWAVGASEGDWSNFNNTITRVDGSE